MLERWGKIYQKENRGNKEEKYRIRGCLYCNLLLSFIYLFIIYYKFLIESKKVKMFNTNKIL